MSKEILIIEDEPGIREMVSFALAREGFSCIEAGTGQEGLEMAAHALPDLIIVDWMLPGTSGLELVRQFRRDEVTQHVPIVMLTARSDESDKVLGLDFGADDYVTKPFSPRELVSRVRALLRRSGGYAKDETLNAGNLSLDVAAHQVTVDTQPVHLGQTEFKLLKFFMKNSNRVYSRAQLLDHVWGRSTFVEERTVDVHILRLRKALKPFKADGMIQTVRGAGYRLSPDLVAH